MYVCLLLPAYNEAKTIDRIILEASEFVHDILVIDDGSIDGSINQWVDQWMIHWRNRSID